MGSCFRVGKKKNSYTVTQLDEEYSSGGGRYNSKSDKNYTGPTKNKQTKSKQKDASPPADTHITAKDESINNHEIQNGNDRVLSMQSDLATPDVVQVTEIKKTRNPSSSSTISVKSDTIVVQTTNETTIITAAAAAEPLDREQDRLSERSLENTVGSVETQVIALPENQIETVLTEDTTVTENEIETVLTEDTAVTEDAEVAIVSEEVTIQQSAPTFYENTERVSNTVDENVEQIEQRLEEYDGERSAGISDYVEYTHDEPADEPTVESYAALADIATPVAVPDMQVTFKDTPETITYTPQVTVDEDEQSYRQNEGYYADDRAEIAEIPGAEYREDDYSATPYDDPYDTTNHTSTFASVTATDPQTDQYEPMADYSTDRHYDEVEITDSPAGTWDARLNTEVRAELDEVRRSLSSSRASSTGSLNAPTASSHPTVRFDVPESDQDAETGGVSVVTVTTTTYTTDGETELVQQDFSTYDNDHNEQLAALGAHVSDYEMVGYDTSTRGEIVLSDDVVYEPAQVQTYQHTDDGF